MGDIMEKNLRPNTDENIEDQEQAGTKVVYFPEQRKRVSGTIVVLMLGVFAMFIAVISGYSSISANNLDNLELQENIDNMKTEIEMLEMYIIAKEDISHIEQRAGELGMDFPEPEQIVDLPASAVQLPEQEEYESESSGIFDLISTVRGWFA